MYSVVVPCYNEEANLRNLIDRFDYIFSVLQRAGKCFELVLVENGSKDNSHAVIASIVEERNYVKEVRVEVNQGYGYGVLQGLNACSGDFLFWLHADLQFPPETVLEIISILDSSETPEQLFIKGLRLNRPLSDRFFTFGKDIFESIYLGTNLRDISAPPTCVSREFYETWVNPPHDFSLELYVYYMAVRNGLHVKRIKVLQSARMAGKSSWNTGMASRMEQIKRTISYSRALKKELRRRIERNVALK